MKAISMVIIHVKTQFRKISICKNVFLIDAEKPI